MTISSRTPEGIPHRCPVCGQESSVEPSFPGGDSCCPICGQLLWWFRDRIDRLGGGSAESITLTTSFAEAATDSLDLVELVMELEEEFDVNIPDDDSVSIKTIEDAIRFIRQHRRQ